MKRTLTALAFSLAATTAQAGPMVDYIANAEADVAEAVALADKLTLRQKAQILGYNRSCTILLGGESKKTRVLYEPMSKLSFVISQTVDFSLEDVTSSEHSHEFAMRLLSGMQLAGTFSNCAEGAAFLATTFDMALN